MKWVVVASVLAVGPAYGQAMPETALAPYGPFREEMLKAGFAPVPALPGAKVFQHPPEVLCLRDPCSAVWKDKTGRRVTIKLMRDRNYKLVLAPDYWRSD